MNERVAKQIEEMKKQTIGVEVEMNNIRRDTGAYLTIEPKKGSEVPVAVWTVTETDEEALDRYEGCPVFYYKKDMELDIRGIRTGKMRKRKCFVYIMHEERKIGIPSLSYVRTCLEGYISFGFDEHYLSEAQIRAVKEAGYED